MSFMMCHMGGAHASIRYRMLNSAPRARPRARPNPALSWARQVTLRPGDVTWADFLASGENSAPSFEPHIADPDEITNVLFSSGTTGVPQCRPVPSAVSYCTMPCTARVKLL